MDATGALHGRRDGTSRGSFAASLLLHLALIAAAALFVAPPPDQPVPIEVSLIVETGETEAGHAGGPPSQHQAEQQQQQSAPQQIETAPRPSSKPITPPRVAAPRPKPKAVPAPAESSPIVEPAAAEPAPQMTSTAASQQTAAAPGPASSGTGSSAGTGSGGGGNGRGANDYLERVRQALAKHKRYPDQARKLKQEGTARLSLVLARDGTVLSAQITGGSGFALLDEATLQMARDASPVPRVPDEIDGDSVKIALPVTFSIGFFGWF